VLRPRDVIVAVVVCVASVAGLHLAGELLARAPAPPTSYDAPRNPYFRRGWVDWTRAPDPLPGDRRIVVISNSQGFLRERPEGEWSYPAALEELLSERSGEDVQVLNWSVPGGKLPEMIVLAARAAKHEPSDIVLVTYTENFVGESMTARLGFGISDVPLLVADRNVRALLSDEFADRYQVTLVAPRLSVHTGFGAVRWRTIEGTDETWGWTPEEPEVDLASLEWTVDAWDELSSEAARDFVATARRGAPDARVWIVTMPLPAPAWTREAWSEFREMDQRVREAVGDAPGVTALEALEVVPVSEFYTHTHMTPAGHRMLAEWLADRLER
jgi:hypothetical protein